VCMRAQGLGSGEFKVLTCTVLGRGEVREAANLFGEISKGSRTRLVVFHARERIGECCYCRHIQSHERDKFGMYTVHSA